MERLPEPALFLVFGRLCDSPMTALAFASCSKACAVAMERSWLDLTRAWSERWGGGGGGSRFPVRTTTAGPERRVSKRLREQEYYSEKRQFVRLVEMGAFHAAEVHSAVFARALERLPLTPNALRSVLQEHAPVWVNCGGFFRERGGSSVLVEVLRSKIVFARHARAICELLVGEWDADVHATFGDGMRPLAVAAARGFPDAVEYLVSKGARADQKSPGTFMVKKRSIKGAFTPLEWAEAMYEAEKASGTNESQLKAIKRCTEILRRVAQDTKTEEGS